MSSRRGLTLVEVVVALLLAGGMVAALGGLAISTVHERTLNGMRSAAVHLAQRRMERLLALDDPASHAALANGTHGPTLVDETGEVALGGPYREAWTVVDAQPTVGAKHVTVRITHVTEERIRCEIETYLKTS